LKAFPAIPSGKGSFFVRSTDGAASSHLPVGNSEGVFLAPSGFDKPTALAVRAHEYGRLAISQQFLDQYWASAQAIGLRHDWGTDVMTAIINSRLGHLGVKEINHFPVTIPKNPSISDSARCFLRATMTHTQVNIPEDGASIVHTTQGMISQLGDQLRTTSNPSPDGVLYYAMMLQELFDYGKRDKPGEQEEAAEGDEEDFFKSPRRKLWSTFGRSMGHHEWGKMKIITLPLPLPFEPAMRALRKRPNFVGGFRHPYRALLPSGDGRAFGLKRRVRGGTILIDTSGSMHVAESEIEDILSIAPAATIATYAGHGEHGSLSVIAADGRRVKSMPNHGAGNVVDGPALRWLATKPSPRVWICDGGVTGIGDNQSPNLVVEAESIQRRNSIKRVDNLQLFCQQMHENKSL